MKLTDMYGFSAYKSMLDNTELIKTKKQIKEQYLQHLLTIKVSHEKAKARIDPVIQAHLNGQIITFLDELKCPPGFEKAPGEAAGSVRSRSMHERSKGKPSTKNKSTESLLKPRDLGSRNNIKLGDSSQVSFVKLSKHQSLRSIIILFRI